jgi:hypothetical protein
MFEEIMASSFAFLVELTRQRQSATPQSYGRIAWNGLIGINPAVRSPDALNFIVATRHLQLEGANDRERHRRRSCFLPDAIA